VTSTGAVDGAHSQRITLVSGQAASVANMGLATQGMYFQADRPYQGYLLARSEAGVVTVRVSLGLVSGPTSTLQLTELDHADVQVSDTRTWNLYNFTLTPVKSSSCDQAATPRTPCHPNPEGVCIDCSGGFAISVVGAAGVSVEIDFAWLEPGSWGLSVAPCFLVLCFCLCVDGVQWIGYSLHCDLFWLLRWQGISGAYAACWEHMHTHTHTHTHPHPHTHTHTHTHIHTADRQGTMGSCLGRTLPQGCLTQPTHLLLLLLMRSGQRRRPTHGEG
jgi:hypothetical protein